MSHFNAPQILIVGAGPTGMIAAIELRRRGLDCRIIERRAGPVDTSRAITVHARTMEVLDDMGIVERWLHGGVPNDGYIFNFRGSEMKPRLDYTRLPTRFPYVLMFNQNESEKILRDHLQSDLGLPIEWRTELSDISEDERGKVTVALKHATTPETTEIIHPQWVLACDGLHSPTREALGIKYEGTEYEGMVMQMIDARLQNFQGSDHLLHYYMSENTFLMIGKLEGPNHRVLISAQGSVDEVVKNDLITPIVAADLPEVVIGEPEWKTTWEIWIRKAERYRQGHVFLCGESGHIHSVAGGQGWNVSMQDAYNLCWKLALVIEGNAGDALLDTYEREREPVSDQVIEGSSKIHEIIMAHGGGLEDRMTLTQTDGWNDDAVSRISGLSYNYRNVQPIPEGAIDETNVLAGDRIGDVQISEHLRLHQLLAHTRFTLLIVVNETEGPQVDTARVLVTDLAIAYGDLIRPELFAPETVHPWPNVLPIADPEGRVRHALGAGSGGEMLLVRPDGYLACRLPLTHSVGLHEFLREFLAL